MKLCSIKKSDHPQKKYVAEFCMCKGKTECEPKQRHHTYFGASGYKDFITYSKENKEVAEKHKEAYLKRHNTESWDKPTTAGSLSRWILWNKPSFKASVEDFKKRFKL